MSLLALISEIDGDGKRDGGKKCQPSNQQAECYDAKIYKKELYSTLPSFIVVYFLKQDLTSMEYTGTLFNFAIPSSLTSTSTQGENKD